MSETKAKTPLTGPDGILAQRGKEPTLKQQPNDSPAAESEPTQEQSTPKSEPKRAIRGGPPRGKRVIEQRRQQVLSWYLRGMRTSEIATQLGYPLSTIKKDVLHAENLLKIEFQKERIYILNQSVAQLDEMWREAWIIYHSPQREGESLLFRRLAALDRALKIHQAKTSLLKLTEPDSAPQVTSETGQDEKTIFTFLNSLPLEMQEKYVEYLRSKRVRAASPS